MSAQWQNKLATGVLWLAGFLIIGILAAFLGYMLYKGLPVLSFDFIFGKPSDITAGGGVGPQFFNTFYILGLSMLFSVPLAVGQSWCRSTATRLMRCGPISPRPAKRPRLCSPTPIPGAIPPTSVPKSANG